MKNFLLSLLIITSIEWNLTWTGFQNAPNWVKAWDSNGNRVELVGGWRVEGNKFFWHVETPDKEYQWDLNFWEEQI